MELTYAERLEANKQLLAKMLHDNEVGLKTKMAYKLAYAFFYGAYEGKIPEGVTLLLMIGRIEDVLPKPSPILA